MALNPLFQHSIIPTFQGVFLPTKPLKLDLAPKDQVSRTLIMKWDNKLISATLLAIFFLWVAGLTGCAWFKSNRVETAEELAVKGMESFEDEDYLDALKAFNTLKERYPYSRYAILAELKVADAHFYRKEYPEAIAGYEEFARLHPKNEVIPYVLYQVGESYYKQLLSEDRDQTSTREAILSFERLLKTHPNSTYASQADEKIRNCRELLAEHELYVGRFYYKAKRYRAALGRFESLLAGYQDVLESETQQEVEGLILVCKEKLADLIE
jgi:outer membrane protein assembly factor BamD